jgi:hypothetical protein
MLIIHENFKDVEKCLIVNVSTHSNAKSEIEVVNDNEINLKMKKQGMNLRLLEDV